MRTPSKHTSNMYFLSTCASGGIHVDEINQIHAAALLWTRDERRGCTHYSRNTAIRRKGCYNNRTVKQNAVERIWDARSKPGHNHHQCAASSKVPTTTNQLPTYQETSKTLHYCRDIQCNFDWSNTAMCRGRHFLNNLYKHTIVG